MAAEDAQEVQDAGEDIFYVAEGELDKIKGMVKEIQKDDVDKLTFPENLPDDTMMVPVDMRGVGEEFEDVEQMLEKLGPKGAAEAFVKAREYFDKNGNKEETKPMTAKEWSAVLEEDDLAFAEGEEEEFLSRVRRRNFTARARR